MQNDELLFSENDSGKHGVHDNELSYPELFLVDSLNTLCLLDQDFFNS